MTVCEYLNLFSVCVVFCYVGKYASSDVNVGTIIPPKVQNLLMNLNSSDKDSVLHILNNTRRIIKGTPVQDNRPYMVYLKLPSGNSKYNDYRRWLCGGVIIHEEYILTSAACIEDAKHFYVVSGTSKHREKDDKYNNMCIKNGAKRAIWKCVPKNYVFEGHENDNIRWMNNDIAVVKVEDEFDFTRRIRGCDFIPQPICYNNRSAHLEEPGTWGSVAGWGTLEKYHNWVSGTKQEEQQMNEDLLAASVLIISKSRCKIRWGPRYHNIIDTYMICTKDITTDLSEICNEKYVDCQDIVYGSMEETNRRSPPISGGGFCENDHGGPLVLGDGPEAMVIGIISACLVKDRTNKCYGPFLYTSVYKNKGMISCAIYKNIAECNNMFRASETELLETHMSWLDHPDGPAKHEIQAAAARKTGSIHSPTNTSKLTPVDSISQHGGIVYRSYRDESNTSVVLWKPSPLIIDTSNADLKELNTSSVNSVVKV